MSTGADRAGSMINTTVMNTGPWAAAVQQVHMKLLTRKEDVLFRENLDSKIAKAFATTPITEFPVGEMVLLKPSTKRLGKRPPTNY